MKIETLSVFPQCYDSVMNESIMRIAQEKGFLDFKAHDLRKWTHDKHRTTDDEPYGGGQGLVMKAENLPTTMVSAALNKSCKTPVAASGSEKRTICPNGAPSRKSIFRSA